MMAKRETVLAPIVRDALSVLGNQIAIARAERGWTQSELARRAGISHITTSRIEGGLPGTAIGTVFQVANLVGVPIFGIEDRGELARLRRQGEETLALIPARIRPKRSALDGNF
jgi:transcriptional regulator with XRE-family HTH domain